MQELRTRFGEACDYLPIGSVPEAGQLFSEFAPLAQAASVVATIDRLMSFENEMKINLSQAEYRLLLDLIYLADWMVSAHDVKDDSIPAAKYEPLVQKILSYANDAELSTLVEKSADDGKFYTTRQFEEEGVMDIVYEYDEESFWMELIDRLAERDVRAAQPDGQLPPFKEYLELAGPIEERYAQEFESHGLQRLKLLPDA